MNEVRIIGGKWKRRKLRFPDRPHLRPSLGRIRETLFGWLLGAIDGASCLDLYAGSGALGFEALSRGAAHVTFVDADPLAVMSLQRNRERLEAQHCAIVRARALAWLERQQTPWDIVFLDPPYASGGQAQELRRALELMTRRGLVHGGSLLYLEYGPAAAPPLRDWHSLKTTRAGESEARLIRPAV